MNILGNVDLSERLAKSKASHRFKGKPRVTRVHRLHTVNGHRRVSLSGKIISVSVRKTTDSIRSNDNQSYLSFSSILNDRHRRNQSSFKQHSAEHLPKGTISSLNETNHLFQPRVLLQSKQNTHNVNSSSVNSAEKSVDQINRNQTSKLPSRFSIKSAKVIPNSSIPSEYIIQFSNTTKNQPSNSLDFTREHLNFSNRNQRRNVKKKYRPNCCYSPTRLCVLGSTLALFLLGITISAIVIGVLTRAKTSTTSTTTVTTATSVTTTTSRTTTLTTTTNVVCGTTCIDTAVSTLSRVAFYSFDHVTTDATGTYPASGIVSPIYVNGWVGSAISFVYSNAQFLSTGHIPLSYRSFTIELWFYATDLSSNWDFSLGGEQQAPIDHLSLFMNIRNSILYFGFFNADTAGSTIILINQWYHAAFMYDNDTQTQSIYLNGLLEGSTTTNSLQATIGNFTIGGAYVGGSTTPVVNYTGYIDHFTISARAKSACEIYLDAVLACYFTFDSIVSLDDFGPNFLVATNNNAASSSGRVNQAIQFLSTLSYISIQGIQALTSSNTVFTISMWVNPTIVLGGATLIHASTSSNGQGTCLAQWGLTSTGFLSVNVINSANTTFPATTSFSLLLNVWTHIAQTFSTTNGNSLYVNGTLITTVSASTAIPVGPYVFLGASPASTSNCKAGSITMGQYYGSIDEYRVFGKELALADICRLANP